MKNSKYIVVTGVSSGIGLGITKVLIQNGYYVFGSVRKREDSERISQLLGENFTPLLMDVTNQNSITEAVSIVSKTLGNTKLLGLVNNAGISIHGPLLHQKIDDFEKQIDVMLYGPFRIIQAFAPLLGTDKKRTGNAGTIINVSSIGAIAATPFLGMYCAVKKGLVGLSNTFRMELMPYGIDVVLIYPGTFKTNIWEKTDSIDIFKYKNTDYYSSLQSFLKFTEKEREKGLSPEVLGKTVLKIFTTKQPQTSYVVGPNKFLVSFVSKLVPERIMDRIITKMLGIK